MSKEWNEMILNKMDENNNNNNNSNSSVLSRYDNNFVKADWEDSMIPCIKHHEHCLLSIRYLILISSFSLLSLVYSDSANNLLLLPFLKTQRLSRQFL